ncbi:MAG: cell division protein ZapA [Clostridia bacterium]|nr:cell division protein ZapA [Clostridia bacterium]
MKRKFTISLLDTPVAVVSDDSEEDVKAYAKTLNERLQSVLWKSRQISKTEAALFCALELLSESETAKRKLDRMEAQMDLYTANITRLKEENEMLTKKVDALEARLKK